MTMSQSNLLRTIPVAWEAAIPFVTDALAKAGLQVVQSFDLQLARATHVACNCPHHGTDQCNCQYAVFLIYQKNSSPITLVAHGRDGKTEVTLIESPEQQPSQALIQQIQNALGRPLTETLRQELAPHAS